MAISERIYFFRQLKGMTQRELGLALGFPERTADVRVAQYEAGTRKPKEQLTEQIAYVLGVSADALNVPNIDDNYGLLHTLFALEDMYGLQIDRIDGELCLSLDRSRSKTYHSMYGMFSLWHEEAEKLEQGKITKEEYDQWRYTYPEVKAKRLRDEMDKARESRHFKFDKEQDDE